MDYLIIPAVIIVIWIAAAITGRLAEREKLKAMDDNQLLLESHFADRPNNKFSREHQRRHGTPVKPLWTRPLHTIATVIQALRARSE